MEPQTLKENLMIDIHGDIETLLAEYNVTVIADNGRPTSGNLYDVLSWISSIPVLNL